MQLLEWMDGTNKFRSAFCLLQFSKLLIGKKMHLDMYVYLI